MKLVETLDNPCTLGDIRRMVRNADKLDIPSNARVAVRAWRASVGGGRDTEDVVELVIEGSSFEE